MKLKFPAIYKKLRNQFVPPNRIRIVFHMYLCMYLGTIKMSIKTNNWVVETKREKLELVFCYQNCSDLL